VRKVSQVDTPPNITPSRNDTYKLGTHLAQVSQVDQLDRSFQPSNGGQFLKPHARVCVKLASAMQSMKGLALMGHGKSTVALPALAQFNTVELKLRLLIAN